MRRFLVLGMCLAAACGSVKNKGSADAAKPDAAPPADSPPAACPAGTTAVCSGNDLVTCDSTGHMIGSETCTLGCDSAATRCNKLDPSNNLATLLDEAASATDLTLMGDATIDTDAGTITDMSGARTPVTSTVTSGVPVPVFVIVAKSFTAGNVTVKGTRALAILSDGAVTLNGNLSVSATGSTNGPGALPSDATCHGGNAAPGNSEGWAGGGGGGFGTKGGTGGTGGNPSVQGGAAGEISGTLELVPLRGGCPGGTASNPSASYNPGGGGGALQIVSNTAIAIADGGMITANGAGGAGPVNPVFCIVGNPCGNGEGGGSGGAILLEAPAITVAATAGIYANGGGGSCQTYGAASPGQDSTAVATGQSCSGQTGSGGNGAAGTTAAQNGGSTSGNSAVGGGAGGGEGRIRVNLPNGVSFAPQGMTSGALSGGVLQTR